jgi:hypothetical protein
MLEVKNLTKGTLDTIHAFYYNSSFFIEPHIDAFRLYIKVPIIEGAYLNTNPNYPYQKTNAIKNLSVSILNKIFDNCIYFEDLSESGGSEYIVHQIKTYIQPGLGIVDWEYYDLWASHYGYGDKGWYYRRLIDFHIAP